MEGIIIATAAKVVASGSVAGNPLIEAMLYATASWMRMSE
jgi:hypothetical protein